MARRTSLQVSNLEDRTVPAALTPVPIPNDAVTIVSESGGRTTVHVVDPVTHVDLRTVQLGYVLNAKAALGDVNGDGVKDLVVASEPNLTIDPFFSKTSLTRDGLSMVRVYDGLTESLLGQITPFEAGLRGGVSIAVGDVNGDGKADIITGAGFGGGPRVRTFSGADFTTVLSDVFAFDPKFRGGVNVAAGDVDGDGRADVIVAAGLGGGPHVVVFHGGTGVAFKSFFAFDANFRGGVNVSAADVNGDGKAEVIVGTGKGGGARVRAFTATGTDSVVDLLADNGRFRDGVTVDSTVRDGKPTLVIRLRHEDLEIVRLYDPSGGGTYDKSIYRVVGDDATAYPPVEGSLPGDPYGYRSNGTVTGLVTEVGSNQIRLRTTRGSTFVVDVLPGTEVTRNGVPLADAADLSSILTGERIRVYTDGRGSILSVAIDPVPTGVDTSGAVDALPNSTPYGRVAAIDWANQILYVEAIPQNGSALVRVKANLATRITLGNILAQPLLPPLQLPKIDFVDLSVGDTVSVTNGADGFASIVYYVR